MNTLASECDTDQSSPKILKILGQIAVISAIGVFISLIFNGFTFDNPAHAVRNLGYGIAITLILWKGNEWAVLYTDRFYSWVDEPLKRLLAGLAAMLIVTVFGISLLNYVFYNWILDYHIPFFSFELVGNYIIPILITIMIVSIMSARGFMLNWRELAIREEQLKKENISARFENLKNQVNPHFLFNSLNALSTLVHTEPDTADQFINQLSKVYRYVLDVEQKEVVTLKTELNFLDSYLYMEKIRFGDKLQIRNDLVPSDDLSLPPMCLQMLVENSIKHNIISTDHRLNIELFINKEGQIVVRNNFNPRSRIPDRDSKGLANISARYLHLCGEDIIVEQTEEYFVVKLPSIITKEK